MSDATRCPEGLLPDGEACPRCGGKRAPSGPGGGPRADPGAAHPCQHPAGGRLTMPTIAEQAAQQRHNGLPTHCAYCREIIAGRAAVGESDDVARADVIAPTASTTFGALAIGAAFRFPPSPATYRKASPYVGTLIAANDDSRAYERTGIDAAHIVEPV